MSVVQMKGELQDYYKRKVSEGKNKMSVLNTVASAIRSQQAHPSGLFGGSPGSELRQNLYARVCINHGNPRGGKVSKNLFWSNEKAFGRFSESLNRTAEAAIFYVTKNGIVWRDLPEGFPTWQTVYRSGAPVVLQKMGER